MANQVVSLLSRLFYTAAKSGEAPAGGNPCRFIQKYRTRGRERFLSEQEFDRLGRVLAELETRGTTSTSAAAALRLLMLTGCGKSEILTLRWDDVDRTPGGFRLRDGKPSPRMVPLTTPALKVLDGIERIEDNPWVIRSQKRGIHLQASTTTGTASGTVPVWRACASMTCVTALPRVRSRLARDCR